MTKKVIIIGATSGMGRELARTYAQNNCIVGATGRRKDMLDSLEDEFPDKVVIESFDVTGAQNIEHLKNLLQQTGGMDILIYNSGYGDPSLTLDWNIDRQTTLTNVNGFVEIVNYTFNYFIIQGHGQIVSISSIAANGGNSYAPAYSASKAFISTYMDGLYIKAFKNKFDIAITDIQPGFIKTKMAKVNAQHPVNKQFWVAPVDKAVKQIYAAIENKKRRAYITKRWLVVAKLMKLAPFWLYKRFV